MNERTIKTLLILATVIFGASILSACESIDGNLQAKNGVFVIPQSVIQSKQIVALKGDWRIVYGNWLDPSLPWDEIVVRTQSIQVPGGYLPRELAYLSGSTSGYGTLALQIKAPVQPKERYAIETVYMGSAYEVFADGTFIGKVGKIGKTPDETQGHINPIVGTIEAQNGDITLMVHFSAYKREFYIRDIIFGTESSVRSHYMSRLAVDLVIVGAALIMGMYHFCLHWLRRKDRSLLFFAIICFVFAVRTLCVGNRFIVTMIPTLGSDSFLKITYISIYVIPMLMMLFMRAIYKRYTPKALVVAFSVFSVAATLITLVTGFDTFDKIVVLFEYVFIALVISVIAIIIRALKNGEVGSGVMFSGFVVFAATGANDMLYELGIIHTTSLTPIGFMCFLFAQAIMLSTIYSNAFKQAEDLAEENLRINEELRRSNEELESTVTMRTAQIRDTQTALEIRNAELKWQALTDPLTGLYNRRYIFDTAEAAPKELIYGMAVVDIDDFKKINDTYGHVVGDEVICQLAQHLITVFTEEDVPARIGGEEFCIFSRITDEGLFEEKLDRLLNLVRNSCCMVNTKSIGFTVSIGYAFSEGKLNVDELFLQSDTAVYQSKRSGKNCCTLFFEEDDCSTDAG